MKTYIFLFLAFSLSSLYGQQVDEYINKAKSDYSSDDFEGARQNLQNALMEIDKVISKEILATLPSSLGGLDKDPKQDATTGSGSMLGLYIMRYYGTAEAEHVEITIADNSPIYGMVSSFLNNPVLSGIAGMSNDQKKVTVNGYKGMLKTEEGSDSYTLMVPFGDSLLTMVTNIKEESRVTSIANQLPIAKIVAIVD